MDADSIRAATVAAQVSSPGAHVVQFYAEDAFLVGMLARFVEIGLGAGDSVVAIATAEHHHAVEASCRERGLDLDAARAAGRYVPADARAMLATFMVGGRPQPTRFAGSIGGLIMRAASGSTTTRVRAFGEMVGLLWSEGRQAAAMRVEEMWSTLLRARRFSLLCAYALADFDRAGDARHLLAICRQHSYVGPAGPIHEGDAHARRATAVLGDGQAKAGAGGRAGAGGEPRRPRA